jgi:hypothetical protein
MQFYQAFSDTTGFKPRGCFNFNLDAVHQAFSDTTGIKPVVCAPESA